jgi:hypothetical protein
MGIERTLRCAIDEEIEFGTVIGSFEDDSRRILKRIVRIGSHQHQAMAVDQNVCIGSAGESDADGARHHFRSGRDA